MEGEKLVLGKTCNSRWPVEEAMGMQPLTVSELFILSISFYVCKNIFSNTDLH